MGEAPSALRQHRTLRLQQDSLFSDVYESQENNCRFDWEFCDTRHGEGLEMRQAGMTADEYKTVLQSILQVHSQLALEHLNAIKHALPQKARQVMVGVHPGQSEEGFFDIVVHLEGPDLYVLHKAIERHRLLFEVKCIDGQMRPDVPMFDPDEAAFSVNDVIVDICMEWIEGLWQRLGGLGLPSFVFGEEGYGTVESKPLLP
jgi:hypothetical protein